MQNIGTFQLTEVNNFIIRLQSCSFLFLQWFTNIASLNDNHSITLFYRSTLTELPVRSQKSGQERSSATFVLHSTATIRNLYSKGKIGGHSHSWCCFYSETVSDFFVLLRNKKKIHLYTFTYQFQMSLKEIAVIMMSYTSQNASWRPLDTTVAACWFINAGLCLILVRQHVLELQCILVL